LVKAAFEKISVFVLNVYTYICGVKIEEAIHQKKFKDPFERALVNLLYTSSWLSYEQTQVFKAHELSMQQYNVLRILKGQHPQSITVNMLIERMIDKSSNASRIVEKLRLKGMLKRKICPEDRRRVDVLITRRGIKVLNAATADLHQLHRRIQNLDEAEVELLNELLNKLRTKE